MTTEIRTNPTSKASSRSSAALTSMGDALLQHYREITTLIAEADRQDVRIRYRIAVHCQEVRNGDGNGGRYGAKAVKKLTQALKWCKSLVYAYADVAVTWPDANKFDELVARSNRFDKPLTWSHFILLATVTDDARREKLIDDSLHNGWTVRELQVMMRTGPTEEYEEADAAETEPKLPPDLAAAIQNYGAQVATFTRTAATFGQHVRRKMEEVDPTDLGDSLLEKMRQARRDINELLEELDETIRHFEERRRSQSPVPNEDGAPTTGDSDEPIWDEPNEEKVTVVESAIPVPT